MADTPVSEEEYAYETLRRFYDYTDVVDGVKGLKNKMFEILGIFKNHLPISKVKSAPIYNGNETL